MKFDTVLICGDRNWDDQEIVDKVVLLLKKRYKIHTLVEGEAPGADTQGRIAGEKYGLIIKAFPAEWHKYGRGAGPIRNAQQLREGKPDICIAFHDDLAESRGTLDMVKKAAASENDIIVIIVFHDKSGEKPYKWVWFSPSVEGFSLTE
jgi:hypothetical protein